MSTTKKLGSAVPTAATLTTIYTVPALTSVVFNISASNTAATTATIKIIVGGDIIEDNVVLDEGGLLERSGVIAEAGEAIIVAASEDGVSFRAYGIEEV